MYKNVKKVNHLINLSIITGMSVEALANPLLHVSGGAEIGNTYLTLMDLYKQLDGKNNVTSAIIEVLQQTNKILDDMMTVECNKGGSHLTTVRSGLPSGTWRKLYEGVLPQKSTNKQVTDATGMLEAWSVS